jgi:hypothetical protein
MLVDFKRETMIAIAESSDTSDSLGKAYDIAGEKKEANENDNPLIRLNPKNEHSTRWRKI